MSLIKQMFERQEPQQSWQEPGISKAEKRRRAKSQASTFPQGCWRGMSGNLSKSVCDDTHARITKNEWCKQVYGGIYKAPEVWRRGRIY
jgi:hypothetical protein